MKKYLITLFFILSFAAAKAQSPDTIITKGEPIYIAVQETAVFSGGMEKMYKYLGNELTYPEIEKKYNIQGKVYITFVVEKNGSLSDFKILKSVTKDIDAEAIRVMKASPKWIPGKQNGVPVRQQYTMAITFSLQNN